MSPARRTQGRKGVDDESSAQESSSEKSSNDDGEEDSENEEVGPGEYTIEAILAERVQDGESEYLVRWEGWDLLASTWEPPASFDDIEVSLKSWRKTKLDILAGRRPKFDVDKFNRDQAKATEEAERIELTLEEYSKLLSTDPGDYFIHQIQSPASQANRETTAGHEPRSNTTKPLAAAVPAQTHQAENVHQPSRPRNQAVQRPVVRSTASQANHEPTAGPPNPPAAALQVQTHPAENSHQPSRPQNQPVQRTELQSRIPVTKPPMANFGTGIGVRRGPKRKFDRAPLPHLVPLLKPSEVSARQPASQTIEWNPESSEFPPKSPVAISSPIDGATQTLTDPFPGPEPHPQSDHETTIRVRADIFTAPNDPRSEPFSSEPSPPSDEIISSMFATEDVPSRLRDPKGAMQRPGREERRPSPTRPRRRSASPLFVSPNPEKRQRVDPTRIDDIHSTNHDDMHAISSGPSESDRHGDTQRAIHRRSNNEHDRRPPLPSSTPRAPLADIVRSPGSAPVLARTQSAPQGKSPAQTGAQSVPIQQKPITPRACYYYGNYFANSSELLVQLFFGPDKQCIGFARVCGAGIPSIKRLKLASRSSKAPPEMWFQYLCTKRDYDLIDTKGSTRFSRLYGNAWLEGFPDSTNNILQMKETLAKQGCVALFTSDESPENAWLTYPRSDQDMNRRFTTESFQVPRGADLVLAIRSAVDNSFVKEVFRSRTFQPRRAPEITPSLETNSRPLSQPTPVSPRGRSNINKERPYDLGAESEVPGARPSTRHSQPRLLESDPYSTFSGAKDDSLSSPVANRPFSNSVLSSKVLSTSSQFQQTEIQATVGTQVMEVPSSLGPTLGSLELASTNNPNAKIAQEMTEIAGRIINLNIPPIEGAIDALQLAARVNEMVTCIKERSIVRSGDGIANQVIFFYLHFPEEEKAYNELLLVQSVLEMDTKTRIFTNQDPREWSKFNENCKNGAVIFHETFQEYGSLDPPIRKSIQQGFYFWSVNVLEPLRSLDMSDPGPSSFVRKIFPGGAAILLTEEACFQNLPQVELLMLWFDHCRGHSNDHLKLVLWPDAIETLEASLRDPARNKDFDRHIVLILTYIRKLNSKDSSSLDFEEESLDILQMDQPGHNVFYLPVVNYGQRKAHAHEAVPHGFAEAELKADHLVEAFAGWMEHHVSQFNRFYVITYWSSDHPLVERWRTWGHLAVTNINLFLGHRRVKKSDFDVQLYRKGHVNKGEQQEEDGSPTVHPHTPGGVYTTPKTPAESNTPSEPQQPAGSSRDPRIANRRPSTSQPSFGYR